MTFGRIAKILVCAEPGCSRKLVHTETKACGKDQFCSKHDRRNEPVACTCETPVPHRLWQLVGCRTCKRVIL